MLVSLCLALAACSGSVKGLTPPGGGTPDGGSTPPGPTGVPFEALGPSTYVPKVKYLLTGLPATDAEVAAVTADPNQLRSLIDVWMTLPGFKLRMLDFFRNAFQQNQVNINVLQDTLRLNLQYNEQYAPRLVRNIMDSFPLTVWELLQEGRPLNEALTTDRYMLTTALMSYMSVVDGMHASDNGNTYNRLNTDPSALTSFTIDGASSWSTDQSLAGITALPDGGSTTTWKFLGTPQNGCGTDAQTFSGGGMFSILFDLYFGKLNWLPCPAPMISNFERFTPQYLDADWTDWRMVKMVQPAGLADGGAGYASPRFYELPNLRAANQMSLATRRIGFVGTLAFAGNWATNFTNEMRVTANQSLIVSIGRSIVGEDVQVMFPVTATEASHATNPACVGCHSQLDPYKQFYRQSYSLYYHDQTDQAQIGEDAGFSLGGVTATGRGVDDVMHILATHPRFPLAWVLKLHAWGNSTNADPTDPEVLRIADAFKASNFEFKTLVRELFSSPLITFAHVTQTTSANGVVMSVARRDQFCAAMSERLGLPDVCGSTTVRPTSQQAAIAGRALMMPVDAYYRGNALPSLPTDPNLFYRASIESICSLMADQLVDVTGGPSRYTGGNPDAGIADLVASVMGLPSADARASAAASILADNFAAARDAGVSSKDALKATFILACISPSNVLVGQ